MASVNIFWKSLWSQFLGSGLMETEHDVYFVQGYALGQDHLVVDKSNKLSPHSWPLINDQWTLIGGCLSTVVTICILMIKTLISQLIVHSLGWSQLLYKCSVF